MSHAKAPSTNDSTDTDLEAVDHETLADVERGDVLVINGDRYPVYRLNDGLRSLFVPDHPEVIVDGEIRALAYGALTEADAGDPEDNPTALAFADTVDADRDEEPDVENIELLAEDLTNVYVERQATDAYDLLRTHDSRESCPDCDSDTSRYQYGRRDGTHIQEVRKCCGDDCQAVWCFDRHIPTDTTAEVTTYDRTTGEFNTTELSGVYRSIVTSRFKLDPRSHAREGWFTAEEVAAFLNPKMNTSGDAERFGIVSERSRGVEWIDDYLERKLQVEFRKVRDPAE